jgi:hypothetical protein
MWISILFLTPEEKRNASDIIKENEGFTMECFIELQEVCKIPTKDMQNMQVCYKCAKEKPHLEYTLPAMPSPSTAIMPPHNDVAQAQATVARSANHGLHTYQLKPEGMKGEKVFARMI